MLRGRASKVTARVPSPSGNHHAKIIGSQAVAHKAIIVQGIIRGVNQADAQSVALLSMPPLSVLAQSSLKSRMLSGMSLLGIAKKKSAMTLNGSQKSMRRLRARKEKGEAPSRKVSLKARVPPRSVAPRPTQSSPTKSDRSQPKSKPEACSCMTNDFLFAMISTKSKPTWRHSTWDGVDYMICTVIDPQKKLPVFKAGKWSLLDDDKIYLYGHDAKTMKHFTLDFASNDQYDTLDRSWFGEMWFPVQRHDYHVQSSIREECLVDPADLDLEYGCEEPDLCFSRSQV